MKATVLETALNLSQNTFFTFKMKNLRTRERWNNASHTKVLTAGYRDSFDSRTPKISGPFVT